MPGYESTFKDFLYLLDVGSEAHIEQVARTLGLTVRVSGVQSDFYDSNGQKLSLMAVHEIGQAHPHGHRLIYNLWMTYAH
jgi:hypothetical protein